MGVFQVLGQLLGIGQLKTYDFRNWLVTVADQEIRGFDDDEGFSIEWLSPGFVPIEGLDGEQTQNYSGNLAARITLNLKQTSDSNSILTLLMMFDLNGAPVLNITPFPVHLVSLVENGGTYRGEVCRIEKPPTITGSKEAGMVAWSIYCPELAPLIS